MDGPRSYFEKLECRCPLCSKEAKSSQTSLSNNSSISGTGIEFIRKFVQRKKITEDIIKPDVLTVSSKSDVSSNENSETGLRFIRSLVKRVKMSDVDIEAESPYFDETFGSSDNSELENLDWEEDDDYHYTPNGDFELSPSTVPSPVIPKQKKLVNTWKESIEKTKSAIAFVSSFKAVGSLSKARNFQNITRSAALNTKSSNI